MLRYVYGQDEIVAQFVAQMIPHVRDQGFGKCTAIGVTDGEGKMIAGVVYHHWHPWAGHISMSVAALPGKRWLTRETISRMYTYPFDELGCQMVVSCLAIEDERLQKLLARADFMFVKVPRLLGRNQDAVIALLTDEEWASSRFNKPDTEMREAA